MATKDWKSSLRVRTKQSKVGTLETHVQQEMLHNRLNGYEKDNHAVVLSDDDGMYLSDHNDDEYTGRGSVRKKQQKRRKKKKAKSRATKGVTSMKRTMTFEHQLKYANFESFASWVPSYLTAKAGPPRYPPKKYCSVCGFQSIYKCRVCLALFCSQRCNAIHDEYRCQKWRL